MLKIKRFSVLITRKPRKHRNHDKSKFRKFLKYSISCSQLKLIKFAQQIQSNSQLKEHACFSNCSLCGKPLSQALKLLQCFANRAQFE